jgi:hypothetical protein
MSYRQGFSQGQSMTGKVGIGVVALGVNCKKTIIFWSFSYRCPEPFLVKCSFFSIKSRFHTWPSHVACPTVPRTPDPTISFHLPLRIAPHGFSHLAVLPAPRNTYVIDAGAN